MCCIRGGVSSALHWGSREQRCSPPLESAPRVYCTRHALVGAPNRLSLGPEERRQCWRPSFCNARFSHASWRVKTRACS